MQTRTHHCLTCFHSWTSKIDLSETTPALSGERVEQCPKCNSRSIMSHPVSTIVDKQTRTRVFEYDENGTHYRATVTLRYDDQCRNGDNTFSITADIRERVSITPYESRLNPGEIVDHYYREHSSGCCHEAITKHCPELAPLIKWHLCTSEGPMHYPANAVYFAGDRDHHGLRKGETRQIRRGGDGPLCWHLEPTEELPESAYGETRPEQTATLRYVPTQWIGEGKKPRTRT